MDGMDEEMVVGVEKEGTIQRPAREYLTPARTGSQIASARRAQALEEERSVSIWVYGLHLDIILLSCLQQSGRSVVRVRAIAQSVVHCPWCIAHNSDDHIASDKHNK